MREIQISGTITVPENIESDQFLDEFLSWVESKGYYFGGSIKDYEDPNNEQN